MKKISAYYGVCPVYQLGLPRPQAGQKRTLSKLYYWVWKSRLCGVLVCGMLLLVSLVCVPPFTNVALADCPAGTPAGSTCYDNPIKATSFPDLVKAIAKAVTEIGSVLAVAAIVFVGIRFVIAAASGDQGGLTKARQMLWYVLIGTAVIVGAAYLAGAVVDLIKNLPK